MGAAMNHDSNNFHFIFQDVSYANMVNKNDLPLDMGYIKHGASQFDILMPFPYIRNTK
jgi:hypothetical protein